MYERPADPADDRAEHAVDFEIKSAFARCETEHTQEVHAHADFSVRRRNRKSDRRTAKQEESDNCGDERARGEGQSEHPLFRKRADFFGQEISESGNQQAYARKNESRKGGGVERQG